jgi:CHAT domain-containing protein/tetratricopeptide (TPR) repeat protein
MDSSVFADLLVEHEQSERTALLENNLHMVDLELAWALKARYDETRTKNPQIATAIAATLTSIAQFHPDQGIRAIAIWTAGRAKLQLEGQPRAALELLDRAVAAFESLDQIQHAASVQVSRLHALALLSRYDEAIACGLQARDILLANDDFLTAGTIEQNLGNIYHRRDQYAEAERYLRLAHQRFLASDDQQQPAQIENCIAIELMYLHRFGEAAALYQQALARSEQAGVELTQAEIETNLGNLALFQGQYDRALDFLERARRRYAALELEYDHVTVELELADVYLELNLIPEALAIYTRIIPIFRRLELQAELARALAHYGLALALAGHVHQAHTFLAEANRLYQAEQNLVGAAIATLFEAQVHYSAGNYTHAHEAVRLAEPPLRAAQAWAWALFACWLRGDIERALGQHTAAHQLLQATLAEAGRHVVPQVVYRCHTSLGLLALAIGNPQAAEAQLCLSSSTNRLAEAFTYVERARSRAFVEMLDGAFAGSPEPRDSYEAGLFRRLATLREELNWLYNQNTQLLEYAGNADSVTIPDIQAAMRERELGMMEINRQLRQRSDPSYTLPHRSMVVGDLAALQRDLGHESVLIEYFAINGELVAFIVDATRIEVAQHLGSEQEIDQLVSQLHYQIDSLRYSEEHLQNHVEQLTQRALYYLQRLYAALLKPLEPYLGSRRLIIVPYRTLHYVPFHALHTGSEYVVEQREVCYAPSALVLRQCLTRPYRALQNALLVGVGDVHTPHIYEEIAALGALLPNPTTLLDEQATRTALFELAPAVDILHLACHGQFRPDNPLFSSLRLGDSWLTVSDMYALNLRCSLVALSACETGVADVAPGDELLGIARGFLSSGIPSLLVSLWAADDASTAVLMQEFYASLMEGERPAAALRLAQLALLQQHRHPFFWSPFIIVGRW